MTGSFEPGPPSAHSRLSFLTSKPSLQVIGLFLGALTTAHPVFIALLPFAWVVPAVIAALLSLIRPARPVATGFAAASLAWVTAYLAFLLIMVVAGAIR
ncbi:MAG: hypothetical protein WAV90_25675 [Gordonia amarae]